MDGMAQLIVEAGFTPAAPGLSAGYLILDDPIAGQLDTGTLADADTWTDISPWAQSATITRASTREQGPVITYEGGTLAAGFNNSDARFSPDNLAGPYVAAGVTQVRPMIPLRARAAWNGVTYPLWRGFAQSWQPDPDQGPDYATVTLTGADAFLVLAGTTLPAGGPAGAGELSGARVNRILAAAGWYAAARGLSVISAGSSAVQAYTGGAAALQLLQVTAASEAGALYVDALGRVTFRGRRDVLTDPRSTTVQAVFGDRPGTLHFPAARPSSQGNSFEGGTNGVAITPAASGGISGQPFAAVTVSGGGSVAWSSFHAAHGTLSAKCVTTASASTANMSYAVTGSPPQLWARFCLYLPAVPAANDNVLQFTDGTGAQLAGAGVSITGQLFLFNTFGGSSGVFATTLPTGQWVAVTVTATFPQNSTAMMTAGLALSPDGSPVETVTISGQNFGTTPVANVTFGPSAGVASNFTPYFDDVEVNSDGPSGPAGLAPLPELYYTAVTRPASDLTIANDIQATVAGGNQQEVRDAASIGKYLFARTWGRSDLILQSDADALSWAQYVAYITAAGNPEFDAITLLPAADPGNLWPLALGLGIGDRIQVWRRPPGMASPIVRDCLIRGVTHVIGAGEWETTFLLQDAGRYAFFTLDDPVLGQLNANALAW